MTTETGHIDPLAEAIADVEGATDGIPGPFTEAFRARSPEAATRDLVLICYSGDLEKTWASLILASTAAASGVRTKVFLTFWGLQTFVKDEKRITGENAMQKMLALMQRPGISHRKLSKMNVLGMGPWMMGVLARQHGVASPKELLEACSLSMDLLDIQTIDLDPLVDGVEGVTAFYLNAGEGQVVFI